MNDETVMMPAMKEESETDRIAAARNKGITIGLGVMMLIFAACVMGTAFGAFLMRVLVL